MPIFSEPVVEFEDEDEDIGSSNIPAFATIFTSNTLLFIKPLSCPTSILFVEDILESLPYKKSFGITVSKFEFAMGLWAEELDLSRAYYFSLYEALMHLGYHPELSRLPHSLLVLKKRVKAQMPLLPLRKKQIPFISEKLSSARATTKVSASASILVLVSTSIPVFITTGPMEDLIFFDLCAVFTAFISAPEIQKNAHRFWRIL